MDWKPSITGWSHGAPSLLCECVELHAFGDASEYAYGGVMYARFFCPDGGFEVSLMALKGQGALLKRVTLP